MPVDDLEGSILLTAREAQAIDLLFQGHNMVAIAEEMGISHETVKIHIQRVYRKRGVKSKMQLVALALRNGGILF